MQWSQHDCLTDPSPQNGSSSRILANHNPMPILHNQSSYVREEGIPTMWTSQVPRPTFVYYPVPLSLFLYMTFQFSHLYGRHDFPPDFFKKICLLLNVSLSETELSPPVLKKKILNKVPLITVRWYPQQKQKLSFLLEYHGPRMKNGSFQAREGKKRRGYISSLAHTPSCLILSLENTVYKTSWARRICFKHAHIWTYILSLTHAHTLGKNIWLWIPQATGSLCRSSCHRWLKWETT